MPESEKKDMQTDNETGLDDAEPAPTTIFLVSKEGKSLEVEKKFAFLSRLVKVSLESDEDEREIPLPSVSTPTLVSIVTYMTHHKGKDNDPPDCPLHSRIMKEVCKDEWDARFVDGFTERGELNMLYELILAANYMDMNNLMMLCCAKVASLVKGQPQQKFAAILTPNYKEENEKACVSS